VKKQLKFEFGVHKVVGEYTHTHECMHTHTITFDNALLKVALDVQNRN